MIFGENSKSWTLQLCHIIQSLLSVPGGCLHMVISTLHSSVSWSGFAYHLLLQHSCNCFQNCVKNKEAGRLFLTLSYLVSYSQDKIKQCRNQSFTSYWPRFFRPSHFSVSQSSGASKFSVPLRRTLLEQAPRPQVLQRSSKEWRSKVLLLLNYKR